MTSTQHSPPNIFELQVGVMFLWIAQRIKKLLLHTGSLWSSNGFNGNIFKELNITYIAVSRVAIVLGGVAVLMVAVVLGGSFPRSQLPG